MSQNTDHFVEIRYSKDGGHNFEGSRIASFGAVGEYTKRIRFLRLGRSRDFRVKIRITSPVCVDILGGYIEHDSGDA